MQNSFDEFYEEWWHKFDVPTRRVWLAMLLITSRGATASSLQKWSGLEIECFTPILQRLTDINLIKIFAQENEKLFTIHNSVRSFLNQKVAK